MVWVAATVNAMVRQRHYHQARLDVLLSTQTWRCYRYIVIMVRRWLPVVAVAIVVVVAVVLMVAGIGGGGDQYGVVVPLDTPVR